MAVVNATHLQILIGFFLLIKITVSYMHMMRVVAGLRIPNSIRHMAPANVGRLKCFENGNAHRDRKRLCSGQGKKKNGREYLNGTQR